MRTLFFPDMHRRMPKAFAKALHSSGWNILLPDLTFTEHIKYWKKWTEQELKQNEYMSDCNNIITTSYEDLLNNPPDVMMITCYEVQDDILKIYDKIKNVSNKTKLLHYAGNNFVPYDMTRLKNIVTTDETIFYKNKINNKNVLFYLPWVDFENDFQFKSTNNTNTINSYILNYNKYFPQAYDIAKQCEKLFNQLSYNVNFIENEPETAIPSLMQNSFATLHIKPIEGYGFSIIESMATGRPVILYQPYSEGKSYKHWSLDMETCIYFSNLEELKEKFLNYCKNSDSIQKSCAQKVRNIINIEKQNQRLSNYMDSLL